MVANHQYTGIDIIELKNLIFQAIGEQRGKKYFDQLIKLLSLKISKTEFDKVCIRTIGKENVVLHNRLIRSIIKNAYMSSTSPEIRKTGSGHIVKVKNPSQKSLQSLYRSPVHGNRRCSNGPSPLGQFGSSPSINTEETGIKIASAESMEDHNSPPSVQSEVPESGVRKPNWNGHTSEHCGIVRYLPDTQTLKDRLEKRLIKEGIGVSMDTANLINIGLDIYLKKLIGSCIRISGSRSRNIPVSNPVYPQRSASASVTDFRVAMETNPFVHGVDWSSQLEKICFQTSNEQ